MAEDQVLDNQAVPVQVKQRPMSVSNDERQHPFDRGVWGEIP
jgi:hypothetical protein